MAGASCAVHLDVPASASCERCGAFCCAACLDLRARACRSCLERRRARWRRFWRAARPFVVAAALSLVGCAALNWAWWKARVGVRERAKQRLEEVRRENLRLEAVVGDVREVIRVRKVLEEELKWIEFTRRDARVVAFADVLEDFQDVRRR
jgi:hypothetical protein